MLYNLLIFLLSTILTILVLSVFVLAFLGVLDTKGPLIVLVGIVSWYDLQNGVGQIDNAYSFHFSVIVGENKNLTAGQQVEYNLGENAIVTYVKPL